MAIYETATKLANEIKNSKEYIQFLKLIYEKYPKGDRIRIVVDNLKVHISEATKKYLVTVEGRFEFVFTPKTWFMAQYHWKFF